MIHCECGQAIHLQDVVINGLFICDNQVKGRGIVGEIKYHCPYCDKSYTVRFTDGFREVSK